MSQKFAVGSFLFVAWVFILGGLYVSLTNINNPTVLINIANYFVTVGNIAMAAFVLFGLSSIILLIFSLVVWRKLDSPKPKKFVLPPTGGDIDGRGVYNDHVRR